MLKLLRISYIPPKIIPFIQQQFVEKKPTTFREAYRLFFDNFIAIADAITFELNKLEDFEAIEVVINHTQLQEFWLKENSQKTNLNALEILQEQVNFYQPDVILVNTGLIQETEIRAMAPKGCFIMAWDGFVKPLLQQNKKYDLILTCLDSIQHKFEKIGTKSALLPFAFDPRVLNFVDSTKTETCTFSGSISAVHQSRLNFLHKLTQSGLDFNLYLGNYDTGLNPFSRTILREIIQNKNSRNLLKIFQLQANNNKGGWGLEMYKILARSVSTLNFHGDEVEKACNIRLFEATGFGTCLVTDNKPGLEDFYNKDEEVLTFDHIDDLIDKLKYLENNPQIAHQIGEAGKAKVFSSHLWEHRVQDLVSIIHKHI